MQRQEIAVKPEIALPVSGFVLVYGSDKLLLETRTMVLEQAGFRVLSAAEPSEAELLIGAHPVSLVVLCHSLSAIRCESVLEFAKSRKPAVRTLVLTAGVSTCANHGPTAVLSVFDGPARLTDIVRHLLVGASFPS